MVRTGMGVPSTPRHRKPCMHTRDEAAAGRQGAEEKRLLHSPLSLGKTHWETLFKVLTPPATLRQKMTKGAGKTVFISTRKKHGLLSFASV